MRLVRIILAVICALLAVVFIAEALTVPAFAATTPALFGIALAVAVFFVWPRRRRKELP